MPNRLGWLCWQIFDVTFIDYTDGNLNEFSQNVWIHQWGVSTNFCSGESTQGSAFYNEGSTSCLASRNKKWSKRRLLWKSLSDILCLLISCNNPSLFRKDQLMCPLQLHDLWGRRKQWKWFWVEMLFTLPWRPNTISEDSRARPWKSRIGGKRGFWFSIIHAPTTLLCLKLLLLPLSSLYQGVQLSYCPSLGKIASNPHKEWVTNHTTS